MRVTALSAAWRIDQGLPADDDVDVAKVVASEGGHQVAAAAQHLHGGVGVDLAYPLHRYTTWSKLNEMTLGSAQPHLAALGDRIAAAYADR
jgi:alkylation response protein AidB-like acyl-CoA dehydrogenase